MKKVFLIAAISALTFSADAQTMFGVQAGANFATQDMEDADEVDIKSKVGLIVGALAEIDFGNSITFRPELNFIQKGFKVDEDGFKYTETLNYIELSPNFVYNVAAGTGRVYFGLGPSFGMGIGGKYKWEIDDEDDEEGDIEMGSDEDEDDVKSFDFGINLLAGYRMNNGLFVTAGYNLGVADISHGDDAIKNRGFSLKLGYMFGGSKTNGSE